MRIQIFRSLILFIISVSVLFADFENYNKNIIQLKSKISKKNELKLELDHINQEIQTIENNSNINWLQKRKLAKLSKEKSIKSNEIFQLYTIIRTLKDGCKEDFTNFISENEHTIIDITKNLNEKSSDRKSLIFQLIEEKQKRDFLIDTQKYFSDKNSFELTNDFHYFSFSDPDIVKELIATLEIKIQNIDNAKNAAQKEIKMRNNLKEFRDEIATFQESQNDIAINDRIFTTVESNGEKNNEYGWGDIDEANYDNSVRSAGTNNFDYNFELLLHKYT